MAHKAKKTEHTGAKHGNGAYWGPKKDAKKESNKIRRRRVKEALRDEKNIESIKRALKSEQTWHDAEPKPEMASQDVLDLYTELENLGVKIWVDGGWGVDALLGKQTRDHKDLDIAINQKDVPIFLDYLKKKGFKEIRRDNEYNVVLSNESGKEIDYHAFVTDSTGRIVGGIAYPNESLTGTGTIEGKSVKCISPEYIVKFHTGYELKEKDFQDVRAICDKFGIELPEEYTRKHRM